MCRDNFENSNADVVLILEVRKALERLGAKETRKIFSKVYSNFVKTEKVESSNNAEH